MLLHTTTEAGYPAVYINGGSIAARSIYSAQIQANAIIAEHLRAGQISSNHISTAGITADNIKGKTLSSSVPVSSGGSFINLDTGNINFAGGNLTWDNTTKTFYINASTLQIGGKNVLNTDTDLAQQINNKGTTRIQGNKLHFTNKVLMDDAFIELLTANNIFAQRVDAREINANRITSGTLAADFIQGGIFDGQSMIVKNITADAIKGGTFDGQSMTIKNLTADAIVAGTLDMSKFTVANLSANAIQTGNLDISSGLKVTSGNHQIISIDPDTLALEFNVSKMSIGGVKLISEEDRPQMEENIATELEGKIKPYLHIAYANNSTGTLGFSITDSLNKLYIGTYTNYISEGSEDPTKYNWTLIKGDKGDRGPQGATGSQGPKGDIGTSVSSVTEYYLATGLSSGVTESTSGWTTSIQPMTPTNKYLWNYEKINFSDDTSQPTVPVIIGVYGDKGNTGSTGATGRSITEITEHYLASNLATGVTRATSGWTTTMQQTTPEKKYLWNYETIKWSSGTTTTYVEPIVIGIHGEQGPQGPKGDTGPQGATGSQGPRGATGTSVESITEYYLATSASSGILSTNTGFTTTIQPLTATNKYLWNYEKINFSDNTSQPTVPVIIGVYGDKGQTGSTGATGRSITGITEHYLASTLATGVTRETSGWTTDMQPTTETKRYLWNYETITWSSGTTTTYVEPIVIGVHGLQGPKGDIGPKGATGSQGPKGDTGTSVSSVTEYYLATSSSSGVTTSTAGWTTTIQTMTETNKYLWNYEKINFSDGTSPPTIPVIIGVYGDKGQTGGTGATGRSITAISEHYLATAAASGVTRTTSGWTTTMQTTTSEKKYLWNYETITWSSGITTTYVEPIIIGIHGEQGPQGVQGPQGATGARGPQGATGVSVSSVVEYYLATSAATGVTTSTTGWGTAMQPMTTSNKYLWNYELIKFSDGSTQPTIPVIIGVHGATGGTGSTGETGRSITAISEHYLATNLASGVTRSTSGWTTTMQTTTSDKKYLWNYETITWSSGTTTTYVEPIIIGIHGEQGPQGATGPKGATGSQGPKGDTGTSVSSITEYYLATSASSGVTTSTSGWVTTIPTMNTTNKYLWNYEKINFSDGTNQPTIPVIIGVHGATGATGGTGATGRSITGITEHYLATSAASGVTRSTSGWTTTMQTTTSTNKYLWNYETITWSSGTTTTYVEPIIIGIHGETGATGATGAKGATGATGPQGVSITKVDVQYYLSTSNTSQVGGSWSTTAPAWVDGRYMWSKTVTTYTSGSPTESLPVCITGAKGSTGSTGGTGATGATGRGITSIIEQFYLSTSKTTQTGGAWSTTMPTWSPGKYVWTRSYITYTTGTPATDTTTPLVSSEWEAINEIEIGGRNLLKNSGEEVSNGNYNIANYDLIDAIKEGEEVTLTIWGSLAATKSYFSAYNSGGSVNVATLTNNGNGTYSSTFKWKIGSSTNTYLSLYAFTNAQTGTSTINKIKLERGNVTTDWTEAPEDTQNKIDEKASAEDLTNVSNDLNTGIGDLSNTVDGKLDKSTYEEFLEYNANIQQQVTESMSSAEENISTALAKTATFEQTLGEGAADWIFTHTRIRMSDEGITLGEEGSGSYLQISDEQISFFNGSKEPVAFINGGMLHINHAIFVESIQISQFMFSSEIAGHLTLRYVGN